MSNSYLAISHIPVTQSKVFDLHLEKLDDISLVQPLIGEANVTVIDRDTVVADVSATYQVELTCDRCNRKFIHMGDLSMSADFGYDESAEYPIDNGRIEISEPIRQELLVHLPIKQLCVADCAGISDIKKGETNGSTKETHQ